MFIKQVWKYPELISNDPHKQKDESSEGDEEEDKNEHGHGHVPDEDFQKVWPNWEASTAEETDDEHCCHEVTEFLVPLVNPSKVCRLIEITNSRDLQIKIVRIYLCENLTIIA